MNLGMYVLNEYVDEFYDVLSELHANRETYKYFSFVPNDLFEFLDEVKLSYRKIVDEDVIQVALVKWSGREILLYLDKIPRVFGGSPIFWASGRRIIIDRIVSRYGGVEDEE